jgi:hypothetical protein
MMRWYAEHGSYTDAEILMGACNLDFCPGPSAIGSPLGEGGQTTHFGYAMTMKTANTFRVTALLTAANGGTANDWIWIDETGTVTKNGIFV